MQYLFDLFQLMAQSDLLANLNAKPIWLISSKGMTASKYQLIITTASNEKEPASSEPGDLVANLGRREFQEAKKETKRKWMAQKNI